MVIMLLVLVLVSGVKSSDNIVESLFFQDSICKVSERISDGCSRKVPGVVSLIDCCRTCSLQASCFGVSLDDTGSCFLHDLCSSVSGCDVGDPGESYWSSYCVNGNWDGSTRSCKCVNGAFGDRCEKYSENCDDLISDGYSPGIYRTVIDPLQTGTNPIRVFCELRGGNSFRIMMLMNKGGLDPNRTWTEYVNGFYTDDNNHFGGLEAWHVLSSVGCKSVNFRLLFKTNEEVFQSYDEFVLTKNMNNYEFTYMMTMGGVLSSGTLPMSYSFSNCLGAMQNTPFSTWDNDHDGDADKNCAAMSGSGWWYSGCDGPCNVMGWGLDDWDNTPTRQRLSVMPSSMAESAPNIVHLQMYMTC